MGGKKSWFVYYFVSNYNIFYRRQLMISNVKQKQTYSTTSFLYILTLRVGSCAIDFTQLCWKTGIQNILLFKTIGIGQCLSCYLVFRTYVVYSFHAIDFNVYCLCLDKYTNFEWKFFNPRTEKYVGRLSPKPKQQS